LGYLPRKPSDRRAALSAVSDLAYTLIFLESPHRLRKTLMDMERVLGDRPAAIARELTKLHEEIWRGSLSEAGQHFDQARGEFVLVVAGRRKPERRQWTQAQVHAAVRRRLARGEAATTIAAGLAAESGWTRREIYKLVSTCG
jgi:16S rRNA (cytidine1402-2'-O)-methyltransferase